MPCYVCRYCYYNMYLKMRQLVNEIMEEIVLKNG